MAHQPGAGRGTYSGTGSRRRPYSPHGGSAPGVRAVAAHTPPADTAVRPIVLTALPSVCLCSDSEAQALPWLPRVHQLGRTPVLGRTDPPQRGPDGTPRPDLPASPCLTRFWIPNICPEPGGTLVLTDRKTRPWNHGTCTSPVSGTECSPRVCVCTTSAGQSPLPALLKVPVTVSLMCVSLAIASSLTRSKSSDQRSLPVVLGMELFPLYLCDFARGAPFPQLPLLSCKVPVLPQDAFQPAFYTRITEGDGGDRLLPPLSPRLLGSCSETLKLWSLVPSWRPRASVSCRAAQLSSPNQALLFAPGSAKQWDSPLGS